MVSRSPRMPWTPPSSLLCGGARGGQHPGPQGGACGTEGEKGKEQTTGVHGSIKNFTHHLEVFTIGLHPVFTNFLCDKMYKLWPNVLFSP